MVTAWLTTEWMLTRPCLDQPWPTTVSTDASLSHLGDLIIYHIIHNSTMVITWLSERTGPSLQQRLDAPTTPLFDDRDNLHYFLTFYKLFELLCLFLPIVLLTQRIFDDHRWWWGRYIWRGWGIPVCWARYLSEIPNINQIFHCFM